MLDKSSLNQLYRYALALTRDEDQAYDLLQSSIEKFLKIATDDISQPMPYLKRSIRNDFIDQYRKQKKLCSLSSISEEDGVVLEQDSPSLESLYIQQRDIEQLIDLLSPEESELLYLWAVEEYTIAEIAHLQNVPKGTLLSKMHRLKKRVKQAMNDIESRQLEVMQ